MRSLGDSDPMPFGKHKGKPMKSIPVEYLHYLWQQGLSKEDKPVANYIRRCLPALKKENTDLIW